MAIIDTIRNTIITPKTTFWCLPLKGDLKYEYNPLRNYRRSVPHEVSGGLPLPPGTLLDLDVNYLDFDLRHPVRMEALSSYDGSVNLILNDGKNLPRMINTRFSVIGNDTYLIVDREGDNDTNIYDEESFDTDTSLYKRINKIIKIKFNGVIPGGRVKVGNYVFYFRLSDSDGNETDFAGESGIVSCYIGNINDPFSILGGNRDENSNKLVSFTISDIDSSYNFVNVYYTRSTSDIWTNETTTAFKILKNYPVYNNICQVIINGYEDLLEMSLNDINIQYLLINAANTQALALNRLFLGNLSKLEIDYKALTLLALKFYPTLDMSANIGYVGEDYKDNSGKYEYYNPFNIYNYLGYWDKEIYRFGVVYIMDDFSLTPVFNICGVNRLTTLTISTTILNLEIVINKDTYAINEDLNCKGVSQINLDGTLIDTGIHPIGIKMRYAGSDLKTDLKKLKVRGYFFVRLKRIPTILCLAVTIALETNAHLPSLPVSESEPLVLGSISGDVSGNRRYLMESFISKERLLEHSFSKRKRIYAEGYMKDGGAAICPEYELNAPFFNQFFTASQFRLDSANFTFSRKNCGDVKQHLSMLPNTRLITSSYYDVLIVAVEDDVKYMKNKTMLYSSRAGEAEEAARTAMAMYKNNGEENIHLFRGSYGPYLGIESKEDILPDVYNIRIPGYDESLLKLYFQIRYQDTSAFYAISDRIPLEEAADITCYRGDCFIGNFTHRMVRNFQDPTNPVNDDIMDIDTWKEHYTLTDAENLAKLNRGDVNAVRMGHWFTTKVCSNLNLSIRSVDHSYASEELTNNRPRNFYPLYSMSTEGEAKLPESFAYNHGFSSTTSDKYNWEMPDVPSIKDVFKTRILYSEVSINDAFKNGYREFLLSHYRDYPLTYGALTTIIELQGNLLAVFEHGIGLIPINERVVSGSGAGGNVFINTANVLPETIKIISDMFGSQWAESVVKTPYFVYGVDTVGKKIWRTNGSRLDIISDFRVQKFLIDNITLLELSKTPIIGIRNVKTHYNAYKSDVMFTFYDILDVANERTWNLCWNEISLTFTTFYSWVPSYSANIDNLFFSFDRDTSKGIAITSNKWYPCKLNREATNEFGGNMNRYIYMGKIEVDGYDDTYPKKISILNYWEDGKYVIRTNHSNDNLQALVDYRYYLFAMPSALSDAQFLNVALKIEVGGTETLTEQGLYNYTPDKVIYGVVGYYNNYEAPTTAFWKHGQAGLTNYMYNGSENVETRIKPCFWYGKLHPFEFEFVVRDDPNTHKIFNNLEIISNKAKPDSFHFEVVGEVYDWAKDKPNMFFRLEATKELYLRLGSSMTYDKRYRDITPELRKMIGSFYYDKSTYLPLYYERRSNKDKIYDDYTMMTYKTGCPRDYAHLSGSEITYNRDLNEFGIWTHIRNIPINSYEDIEITQEQYAYINANFPPNLRRVFAWKDDNENVKYYERVFYGRLRGNSQYLEDKWNVQIPSITFMLKNEPGWAVSDDYPKGTPPIIVESNRLPDIQRTQINELTLPSGISLDSVFVMPNTYDRGNGSLTIGGWTSRKETKIRDKYVKIRIRYSGEDLAVISAIKTLYTISYA